jgi:hypothetical protein
MVCLIALPLALGGVARAADLRFADPGGPVPPPAAYERLWSAPPPTASDGPRPRRRLMGGSDYVGSVYGLGKPAVSGIGPRPDWGRSTAD